VVEIDRVPIFRHGQDLGAGERADLEELRDRLRLWLRPASVDDVAAELVLPLDLVRPRRDVVGAEEIVAAQYSEALHGRAIGALKAARVAINRNEAPGIEARFMPTPTELAREVQRQTGPALVGLAQIERYLAAKEEPAPISSEERERRREHSARIWPQRPRPENAAEGFEIVKESA